MKVREAVAILQGLWLRGVKRRPSMKAREAVAILQRTWLQGVRRRPNMKALEFCLFVCLFEFFLVFVF